MNSSLIRNAPSTQSIRITEPLATQLLQAFEDRALQIPIDQDLRKPECLVSPSSRVSIAAARDGTGHADHFWSLAVALDAAQTPVRPPPASAPRAPPSQNRTRMKTFKARGVIPFVSSPRLSNFLTTYSPLPASSSLANKISPQLTLAPCTDLLRA